jgi:hypothetical protein
MLTLIREGGFSMWIILLLGVVTLVAAGVYAMRGDRHATGFIEWMNRATLYSTLVGVVSDLAAVGHHVSGMMSGEWKPPPGNDGLTPTIAMLMGFGESMAPAIVGFAILSMSALLTAIGHRRMAARAT